MPDPRIVREQLGLSQSQLAREIGVSTRTVQSWEQGWRTPSPLAERALEMLSETSK